MFHSFFSYLRFLLRSTNHHGVHSPFVFGLVTRCFYDKKKYEPYSSIQRFRRELFSDQRKIKVTDLGAGSKIFSSNHRKISAIAKHAGITKKKARLLNRLVRYLQAQQILELGTSVGLGAFSLAAGNKTVVHTIEGCPETAAVAKEKFKKFETGNIETHVGRFEDLLNTESSTPLLNQNWSLVYFDGHHRKEPTLRHFEQLLPTITNDSVFIFDDIHWSSEMETAWEQIKSHPEVRVTIDTFFWGMVFFRKEQAKQHFIIRV